MPLTWSGNNIVIAVRASIWCAKYKENTKLAGQFKKHDARFGQGKRFRGVKGKRQRIERATRVYLVKANALPQKLEKSKSAFPREDIAGIVIIMEPERFMDLLQKNIGLPDRWILKGEEIPHGKNVFCF